MINYQEIIEKIEILPLEEEDDLFKLILKRRVEQRRSEIVASGEMLRHSIKDDTARKFNNVEDLKTYLFDEGEE